MITFRKVSSLKDIDVLAKKADEIWHEYFPGIITVEQIDYMVDLFLSPKAIKEEIADGYIFYSALNKDNEMIGFAVFKPEEDRLFISKLYVEKSSRGKGYGSEMFNKAIEVAREHKLDRMYLTVNKENESAINIYKHKGFKIIDSVVNDIGGGFVMDDYIFEAKVN